MDSLITIDRTFGSGGREIGERAAELLGVEAYANARINAEAEELGYLDEIVEEHDGRANGSLLYNLVMNSGTYDGGSGFNQAVFSTRNRTILEIASRGPAVFIGRNADVVLAGRPELIRFFLYAPEEARAQRILRLEKYPEIMTSKDARDYILKNDRRIQGHYRYSTLKHWGQRDSYDFLLDTSVLGVEGSAKMIVKIVEAVEAARA